MYDAGIELTVWTNFFPGSVWWHLVTAVATSTGTIVTDTVAVSPDSSPEIELVRMTAEFDCFRGLISVLAADDAEGGIPASVMDDIHVLGLGGWQADFAKFCWVRDADYALPLARDFIDFDDWHLEHLYQQAGALSDLYKPEEKALRPIFHDSFWQLWQERGDIAALASLRLPEIVRYLNLTGHPDFWGILGAKVHDLAVQARSEAELAAKKQAAKLAPIRAYAERAIWQRVGGSLPGVGNGLRHNGIIEYIESYLKNTGTYPVGRHRVMYYGSLQNSRPQPSIGTFEVQFPEAP